ncbi:hypothetical protein JCM5296_002278 [Sporobolomyces johnsonii]
MNFAELRKKAATAASSAKDRSPSFSKPTKYAPVRPDPSTSSSPSTLPTPAQRRAQSTVIQHQAALNRPPPPPKRADWSTSSVPTAAGAPPAPARKPAALAPPAPPPRTPSSASSLSSASHARPIPAPPYQYATSHDLPAAPAAAAAPVADLSNSLHARLSISGEAATARQKKFTEYTDADKQDMFAALDTVRPPSFLSLLILPLWLNETSQFFEAKLGSVASSAAAVPSAPSPSPAPYLPTSEPTAEPTAAPPPVALLTRPRLPPTHTSSSPSLPIPSYPPTQSHSSSALSLLHYLLHTPFPTPWFTSSSTSPLPPPLAGRSDVRTSASWMQRGDTKQLTGVALFGDTSIAWWRLTWTASSEARGTAQNEVGREGRYRPVSPPGEGEELYGAHEVYGPRLAGFAREAVDRGAPVGRGECWDLAHEGLEVIQAELGGSGLAPFPSIGRTHGRRLFYAKAAQRGETTTGRWEGGDTYVREGDVVEWRKVRIREEGAPSGSWSLLGDPDHTAIVLSASPPLSLPSLSPGLIDPSYPLAALGALTVVEQSLGQVPQMRTYDLGAMSEGEVWIYRPAALRDVVGVDELRAEWPEDAGVECWSVGELE